jgi:hypothetical protein
MIDTSPFTDEQWYAMCDANMSMPEPLSIASKKENLNLAERRAFGDIEFISSGQFTFDTDMI